MLGFLSFADLGEAVAAGIEKVPMGVDMVVGIPRSGMIPAYMIGLYRNLPVMDLPSFLAKGTSSHGFREIKTIPKKADEAKYILLVDDSLSTGRAMRDALKKLAASGYSGKITTCAVVVSPQRYEDVDLHFCEMPHPRLFEWNAFHQVLVEESCFDMDGILCVDPTPEQNDDGPRYEEFLRTATPRFRPTRTIGHIVSARLEKYRGLTEQWLSDNRVSYGKLHLIDLPSAKERVRLNAHCPHKAKVYISSGASIFYESEPSQAQAIARMSSKPVLCTGDMCVYLPGVQLRAIPSIVRWQLAKPIGRIRSKARSLRRALGGS